MTFLIYLNMALILAVATIYGIQIRRNHSPYGPLKIAMVLCMVVSFLGYVQLLIPDELFVGGEALYIRISYTLLLLCILFFGLVGLNRKR